MTDPTVTIVDYGIGNIFSICRAIEACGGTPVLTGDPDAVVKADRVILPGVGAFGDGMAGLASAGLKEAIIETVRSGQPLLGICLGMQMLLDGSDEFGENEGLGLIAGWVREIPKHDVNQVPHKVPHIGWTGLVEPRPGRWSRTILDRAQTGIAVYFVHSFSAVPGRETDILANCDFGGHTLVAAVRSENITGCQFHPERSGPVGLHILDRFMRHG